MSAVDEIHFSLALPRVNRIPTPLTFKPFAKITFAFIVQFAGIE
jgi:hypothetical protein